MRNPTTTPPSGSGGVILCLDRGCGAYTDGLEISASTMLSTSDGGPAVPATTPGAPGATPVMIDGHSATVYVTPGFMRVTFEVDGLQVEVDANGTAINEIGGEPGLVKFLNTITWYGGDPSHWTTNVIG